MRVVSWGGGVNSTALLIGMHRRGLRPYMILFADTGGEKPATYAFRDGPMAQWIQRVGFPTIETVRYVPPRSPYRTLEEECLTLQKLPALAYGFRQCSQKWKIRPQDHAIKLYPASAITKVIGIDAGEAHRARPPADGYSYEYPLIDWNWGREECVDMIRGAGLCVPPKSACFFCPATCKHEVIALSYTHPDLFNRAVAMEQAAADGNHTIEGLGRHWSWRQVVRMNDRELNSLGPPIDLPCMCADGEPLEPPRPELRKVKEMNHVDR